MLFYSADLMEYAIYPETGVKTIYDKNQKAHLATIDPPPNVPVKVFIHIDKYEKLSELDELFLYNFDKDSNSIEFAFGEKMEHGASRKYISYTTDPDIHKPPFKIQITHQLETADLEKYAFSVSYNLDIA
jgi:hypothetical protein